MLHGAQIISNAARQNAPQGPSGDLKRSCVAKLLPRKFKSSSISIAAVDSKIAPHARLVEFGTAERYPKKKKAMFDKRTGIFYGKKTVAIPAHPFFRPAWDMHKEEALNLIEEGLNNLIMAGGVNVD